MTRSGISSEVVEIVVESNVDVPPDGGTPSISVGDARVVLRVPPQASAGGRSAVRVDLLWLMPAESEVLERDGRIDATAGLGAVLAPLLAGIGSAGLDESSSGDRKRLAIMARGLLSAVAAERVVSEAYDASPQRRLAVLAMQRVHSQLEDPDLTSGSIARQLGAHGAGGVPWVARIRRGVDTSSEAGTNPDRDRRVTFRGSARHGGPECTVGLPRSRPLRPSLRAPLRSAARAGGSLAPRVASVVGRCAVQRVSQA